MKLLDRLKSWRERKAWKRKIEDYSTKMFVEFQDLQLKDYKLSLQRQKKLKKLAKKIYERESKDDYVV